MSLDTDSTIQLGHDIISTKYYALATCAILFYDYFLTLADEIKYIWIGKQSWIFWLFFFNRYFPMTWQLWRLGVEYSPQSQLDTEICHKTAWYSLIVFVLCTLVAQVVLTIRIYAVTMKNGFIVMAFAVITTSQFVLGMCAIILAAGKEESRLCRSAATTNTPGRIPRMHIRSASTYRGCVHEHIPCLWCYALIRFSRVLLVRFLGEKVEGGKARGSDDFGHHRGGRGVVLPRYIPRPSHTRFHTESCTAIDPASSSLRHYRVSFCYGITNNPFVEEIRSFVEKLSVSWKTTRAWNEGSNLSSSTRYGYDLRGGWYLP